MTLEKIIDGYSTYVAEEWGKDNTEDKQKFKQAILSWFREQLLGMISEIDPNPNTEQHDKIIRNQTIQEILGSIER